MKRRFDDELIERIKNANDIVSVISEHVALKKKGKNYWGCCPFHNEKTPSFSVTPDKGFFYCFGCRASGNVFTFLMRHENLTFLEAVEKLADRANIELPTAEMTPGERYREAHRQDIYKVNGLAATFFHNCLTKTNMGKAGLEYLTGRGLSMDTIEKFQLGFAPDHWDRLYKAFSERDIDERLLLETGLCRKNNGKVYDYFRNRVMFPICDGKGRVVGFGGRVMDDSTPKYLNSPETEVFDKGRLLFAFDKAYRTIREKKQAILVEGYMDVIGAHNRGITNVVASLGTAFTKDQGQLLVRQAEEIILAYDMDEAGQKAARRAIDLLQNTDFKVRVAAMPDGKDPDDYVRNHGPAAFLALVDKAVKPFEFLLNDALIQYDSTTLAGKLSILETLFPFIAATASQVRRDDYLRALSLPLWLDASSVFRHFRDYVKKDNVELKDGALEKRLDEYEKHTDEDALLAMALGNEEALGRVLDYVPPEDFHNPLHRSILVKAASLRNGPETFTGTALEQVLTEEEAAEYSRIMVVAGNEYDEELLDSQIRIVRLQSLREQYKEHSVLADKLNRAGDSAFIQELKKCQEIQELIRQWS